VLAKTAIVDPPHEGMGIGAYEMALSHARQRKAFGKRLIEHQAIAFKLAEMFTELEATKNLVFKAAWLLDRGTPNPAISSAAKLFVTEVAYKVCHEALKILGGYGCSKDYDIENREVFQRREGRDHIRGHERGAENRNIKETS